MEPVDVGRRIRSVRKGKGLTLQELAARSGMSATAISAIERNVSSPTVNTLAAIGRALGSSLSSLLGESEVVFRVTRAGEREKPAAAYRGVPFESLAAGIPGQRIVPLLAVLPPGAGSGEAFVTREGDELFVVLEGALDVELGGTRVHLGEGDSLYFRGGTACRFRNAAEGDTRLLLVSSS